VESSGEQTGSEGCLSVPGKAGMVTRPNYVKAVALDVNMKPFELEGTELLARAICHELDHLDGHLYVEKVEGGNFSYAVMDDGTVLRTVVDPEAVFLYDTSKYIITDYKKEGIDEAKNSDVANMKITINEEEKAVAVSDTLIIKNENIYNINIGLKEIGGFDLKLDKYVSKITVKNSNGAKTYTYDNTKLAKLELDSKTAKGTTLIIEYKLLITNEGSVPGYVKKIVDYIPKELKFSSELNSAWYLADDGNVYNSELANTKINSGESKEVTLILTKQITGENTGLINNNAEILESYNDYGIADIDSVAGNKQTGEDDISNADVFIGVKTGSPITYIGLSIVIMMVLGAGAYLINTKVLLINYKKS
jgi:hypothetical protein